MKPREGKEIDELTLNELVTLGHQTQARALEVLTSMEGQLLCLREMELGGKWFLD
jgi:hypothetical protein